MKMALAGVALGIFFQGIWGFCKELGGEECFWSPFEEAKHKWGCNFGICHLGLDRFNGIIYPRMLTVFSMIGIVITIIESIIISYFILKKFSKLYLFNCMLLSFSIACQIIYLYCDFIGTTRYCPRNFAREYLKQDFDLILIPEIVELIKDLNLNPELIEALAYFGIIFTISQLIIITKNIVGHPLAIVGRLVQVLLEVSFISCIIFLIFQSYSDHPKSFNIHEIKSIIEQLY